jgi:hypothetical protein
MRVRGFSDLGAVNAAVRQVIADIGATALPIVGILAAAGRLSVYVAVPEKRVKVDPGPSFRTELRIQGFTEIMVSVPDLLGGSGTFGFLAVQGPVLVLGEQCQPPTDEPPIAIVPELIAANGPILIGPPRCARCNHAIPTARARIAGPGGLCVRCQSEIERSKQ